MIRGAKTIGHFYIYRWMDLNGLYRPAFKVETIDGNTVKITDINNESALITYQDGEVRMEIL